MYCMCDSLRPVRFACATRRSTKLPLLAKALSGKHSGQANVLARILQREACGVKRNIYNILWYGCGSGEAAGLPAARRREKWPM
jgi:hypothetical protein